MLDISKRRCGRSILSAACALAATSLWAGSASALIEIRTNQGAPDPLANIDTVNAYRADGLGGADAEIREDGSTNPTTNREPDGAGTNSHELATRHSPDGSGGFTNHSRIMLRFDISSLTAGDLAANPNATIRMHVNTTSWTQARSFDQTNQIQFGMDFYGLNHDAPGQNWVENEVTWNTAPGLNSESVPRDLTTPDWNNTQTTDLGRLDFVVPAPFNDDNNLPVGFAWDFSSQELADLVAAAVNAGNDTVTFYVQADPAASGFNYIFAQKNTPGGTGNNQGLKLTTQTNWDPDGSGPMPQQTSPYSGMSNADGLFSPKLILSNGPVEAFPIPEPASLSLLALAGAGLMRRRVS